MKKINRQQIQGPEQQCTCLIEDAVQGTDQNGYKISIRYANWVDRKFRTCISQIMVKKKDKFFWGGGGLGGSTCLWTGYKSEDYGFLTKLLRHESNLKFWREISVDIIDLILKASAQHLISFILYHHERN